MEIILDLFCYFFIVFTSATRTRVCVWRFLYVNEWLNIDEVFIIYGKIIDEVFFINDKIM